MWCHEESWNTCAKHYLVIPVLLAILSGIVTPRRLQWFTAFCVLLPVVVIPVFNPGYHGALLVHLWRDIQRVTLTSNFYEFVSLYVIALFVVWAGYAVRFCVRRVLSRLS